MDRGLPDFDAIVASYEAYAEPATALFGRTALELADVAPGETVLDVAAGTGALTLPLLAAGARVTAIDLSAPMMMRLATRIAEAGAEARGEAIAMDGQALAFEDARFDVAVSMFGVMLFPDYATGLREMTRVVRPGGRVIIGSWTGLTAPMRLFSAALSEAFPDRPPVQLPPGVDALGFEARVAATLAAAGLTLERVERVTHPWTSPPRERIAHEAEMMSATIPHWTSLDADEHRRLVTTIDRIARAEEGTPFDSTALVTLARR